MTIPRDLSNLAPGASAAGVLGVTKGGTGLATLTANNVIIGNGTSSPLLVAPGTSGNVLTSNGTTWTSAIAPSGVLAENNQVISSNYVVPAAKNALSLGPITINTGISVTVGTTQQWLIF